MRGRTGALDDAALLEPEGDGPAMVYTIDVITPIVDDAQAFGRIAACNAISDVYAMGGVPQVALSFVGMPDSLGLDTLKDVMLGMANKAHEAGVAIVGGHTIKDTEPKAGLAVIGTVPKDAVWTQTAAQAGQTLVLTKPLGTGVLAQAAKKAQVNPSHLSAAVATMEMLNAQACEVGRAHGVTAATDVTGFGMLGHLSHLAKASSLSVELDIGSVPYLEGAQEAVKAGFVPGGSKRNLAYVRDHLKNHEDISEDDLLLLADAQTSGGLLMAVPATEVNTVVAKLPQARAIGRFIAGEIGHIYFG
jgi:selenide, water dikinase